MLYIYIYVHLCTCMYIHIQVCVIILSSLSVYMHMCSPSIHMRDYVPQCVCTAVPCTYILIRTHHTDFYQHRIIRCNINSVLDELILVQPVLLYHMLLLRSVLYTQFIQHYLHVCRFAHDLLSIGKIPCTGADGLTSADMPYNCLGGRGHAP